MGFFDDLRDMREGKIRADYGDRLVKIESWIIGAAIFAVLATNKINMIVSAVIGIAFAIVFPILMSSFKTFAKVAGIILSVLWAFLGYAAGFLIFSGSVIAGLIVAVIVFALCYFAHRVFGKVGFVISDEDNDDGIQEIIVTDCPNCGGKIEIDAKFCSHCGVKFID